MTSAGFAILLFTGALALIALVLCGRAALRGYREGWRDRETFEKRLRVNRARHARRCQLEHLLEQRRAGK